MQMQVADGEEPGGEPEAAGERVLLDFDFFFVLDFLFVLWLRVGFHDALLLLCPPRADAERRARGVSEEGEIESPK
jgi:hypothetical protein